MTAYNPGDTQKVIQKVSKPLQIFSFQLWISCMCLSNAFSCLDERLLEEFQRVLPVLQLLLPTEEVREIPLQSLPRATSGEEESPCALQQIPDIHLWQLWHGSGMPLESAVFSPHEEAFLLKTAPVLWHCFVQGSHCSPLIHTASHFIRKGN